MICQKYSSPQGHGHGGGGHEAPHGGAHEEHGEIEHHEGPSTHEIPVESHETHQEHELQDTHMMRHLMRHGEHLLKNFLYLNKNF